MAEDISAAFVAGQLAGLEKLITATAGNTDKRFDKVDDRLDRSDEQTEAKFLALDSKMETNKQEAIAARDIKHDQNQGEMRNLRDSMDGTAVIARESARWIAETGAALVNKVDNIHDRVTSIEDGRRVKAAEERGTAKTWAWISGAVVAVGGALGGVLAYGKDALEFIRGLHHG